MFYTPRYITKYIVENTVGALCTQQKEALQINEEAFAPQKRKANRKALLATIDTYRQWLLQLTICDPACGSGAFLNAALEFLKAEHKTLDELTARMLGEAIVFTDLDNSILENNLFGVDINEDAVEIAKLSLWLHTAKKGRKLSNLSNNIKCGNSLIDDPTVAGDKAFNWEEKFKSVFDEGGFDVVIGNPPYVSSKSEMHKTDFKNYWLKFYKTAVYQIDTYLLFIEKSKSIINAKGILSLIIPNAWLNNVFMAPVRKFILENMSIDNIVRTPNSTFADANVDTIIVKIKEFDARNYITFSSLEIDQYLEVGKKMQSLFLEDATHLLIFRKNESYNSLIKKVERDIVELHNILSIARGVGIYHKRVGHTKSFIEQDPFFSTIKKDETFVPYLRGKNISRYQAIWNNDSFISYGKWLAEPREPKFFDGERVLLRQIPGKDNLYSTYLNKEFIIDQSVFIGRNEKMKFETLFLTAILNSCLMAWYFRNKYSEFDELFPKVKLQHFKDFPIKKVSGDCQQNLSTKADIMLSNNKELNQLSQQFTQLLQAKFPTININNKLQQWYSLTAGDFLKEPAKQKIKLTLPEQQEWLQYFEQQKAKANSIQHIIQQTDKEIDAMVYALYGLTEEEIAIVEGK